MPGEQTPIPPDQDCLRPACTGPAYVLRLILEVDLPPDANPTDQEAARIFVGALGSAALDDLEAQIRLVTYDVDDQRLDGTLAMPFPDTLC